MRTLGLDIRRRHFHVIYQKRILGLLACHAFSVGSNAIDVRETNGPAETIQSA
jgi:hypothetical protein